MHTLESIPLSNGFTSQLTPDQATPDPEAVLKLAKDDPSLAPLRRARMVRGHFSFVSPDTTQWGKPELLLNSRSTIIDVLGLDYDSISGPEAEHWLQLVSGRDNALAERWYKDEHGFSWAQCYGGHQFGQWASQLGDGRAITIAQLQPRPALTELPTAVNAYQPSTPIFSLDLQLKGAGKTPYGRFADGLAVLRSSIREFLASEYLASLKIPTTRAAALIHYPQKAVQRERLESSAIVTRLAQGSWIRFGSFEIHWSRNDRAMLVQLADHAVNKVYNGLPADSAEGQAARANLRKWCHKNVQQANDTADTENRESEETRVEVSESILENPYAIMFAAIASRHAKMTAYHQAYGFLNGVNNSDNQLITGHTLDFGPYAFLDNYDLSYTPNHDDMSGRYSYQMQPSIARGNLQYLGNALGELIGSYQSSVSSSQYSSIGVYQGGEKGGPEYEAWKNDAIAQVTKWNNIGEQVVTDVVNGFPSIYIQEYKALMFARLGIVHFDSDDFKLILSPLLDLMEANDLDYHHTLRLLAQFPPLIDTPDKWESLIEEIVREETQPVNSRLEDVRRQFRSWLMTYAERLQKDGISNAQIGQKRKGEMQKVNPRFILRSWVLGEIVEAWRLVEQAGLQLPGAEGKTSEQLKEEEVKARRLLAQVMALVEKPFEAYGEKDFSGQHSNGDALKSTESSEEARLCGLGARQKRMTQCSCSS